MSAVAETTSAPGKFQHPNVTATGERRARVALHGLRTLWFNTGTLCNLTCANCYIESSPRNDRLVYLSAGEVSAYLDELDGWPEAEEVGFTGGEPFMNPDLPAMLADSLGRGYRVLVLTNAMRPMMKQADALARLRARYGARLGLRVSIDHYAQALHEAERGANTWWKTVDGLKWLADSGFKVDVAGRTRWGESEAELRAGYRRLFAALGVAIDADDPASLVLFPEMDAEAPVPEITTACWDKVGVSPDAVMCADSRMVVKRKGAERPVVLACTLVAYDRRFEVGTRLADMDREVKLNHPHCAKFCVLGGASCSAR